MYRSTRICVAVGLAIAGMAGIATEVDADSTAVITASFDDGCRDFGAHASKDISHVVIDYADGRVVNDETISRRAYWLDGGPGDEITAARVKAGQTVEWFRCVPSGAAPPVALLETSSRCVLGACAGWTAADSDGSHERCTGHLDSIPFRGVNSTDPDGDVAIWQIDFGDGSAPATGTWESPPADVGHVFVTTGGGMFTVTLTLTDSTGRVDTDTIAICLVDLAPD